MPLSSLKLNFLDLQRRYFYILKGKYILKRKEMYYVFSSNNLSSGTRHSNVGIVCYKFRTYGVGS